MQLSNEAVAVPMFSAPPDISITADSANEWKGGGYGRPIRRILHRGSAVLRGSDNARPRGFQVRGRRASDPGGLVPDRAGRLARVLAPGGEHSFAGLEGARLRVPGQRRQGARGRLGLLQPTA